MPAQPNYQITRFGVGSTVVLSKKGGAVLGGIWISTKGTTPTITVYDSSIASTTVTKAIASTTSVAKGFNNFLGVELGTGLTVKTASCTGAIFWRPSQSP